MTDLPLREPVRFGLPELEAVFVKLNGQAALGLNRPDDLVLALDGLPAGVAELPISRHYPDIERTASRETSGSQLPADQLSHAVLVHAVEAICAASEKTRQYVHSHT
jgi:hypothetical protein